MRFLTIMFILSAIFIAGCATQTDTDSNEKVTVDVGADTTAAVPAPGNEDVEEKVVVEDSSTLQTDTESTEETTTSSVKEFTITARRFQFDPNTIRVNEGDTVRLNIMSMDVAHGFSLQKYSVNEYLRPGIEQEVEFVADKKGTFRFFCTVPCGSGHSGMLGQLVVN